jgi:hypothetical protein
LFQICLNRFSNFHYIVCRNNLDNIWRKFELRKASLSPMVNIRVLSNCIKLILRFLSKSKYIELLWFVHIIHHNSLLCIATKKSRFIWLSYEYILYIYNQETYFVTIQFDELKLMLFKKNLFIMDWCQTHVWHLQYMIVI